MSLKTQIKSLEGRLGINQINSAECRCGMGVAVEFWQQLVDGHVSQPIGSLTRTSAPAKETCGVCGGQQEIIALHLITTNAADLQPVWSQ